VPIDYLEEGFKAVRRNKGAPGIDGVTIAEFGTRLEEELEQLKEELESWTYKPQPVKRVEIPKPGKGAGVRLLGIPCVRDRIVHATLKILLEPILDPMFSDNSYGFRPGCNQRQAVETARRLSDQVRSTWWISICRNFSTEFIMTDSSPGYRFSFRISRYYVLSE
jgi:retron-type reverse transcriptase